MGFQKYFSSIVTLNSTDTETIIHSLPNGLRIIHKPTLSNVSYCGFFVNAGTRDERPDQFGMAHFTEHMLFKGTRKRKSFHIINRMENVGGELNAYTNKEETVFYSVFVEEHVERAIELLSDLTFHSVFPEKELAKEIDVVIDEINSYEDNPSELIYDEFENLVFEGHELGHNILGETELLKTFRTEKVAEFVRDHYSPSEMVFFSMGKTNPKKLIRLIEKYTEDILRTSSLNQRKAPLPIVAANRRAEKDTSQAHTMIGTYSYPIRDVKRRALNLLNNILGGPGMNSRLNISLREKRGYVYSVESSITNYSDTGLFSIYFGGDQRNQQKCVELVMKELDKFRTTKLSTIQLAAAKKQYIGQIGISHNMQENTALALGKSLFYFGRWFSEAELVHCIERLTAEQLLEVANEIFEKERLFYLQYT